MRHHSLAYYSFAYSALASFRMGMSGSASFVFPDGEKVLIGGALLKNV